MNFFVTFALICASTTAVFAEPVKITKTKIICSDDKIQRVANPPNATQDIVTKGKISEGLRSSWTQGSVEYRQYSYKSFNLLGDVSSTGTGAIEFTTQKVANKVTEAFESLYFIKYNDPVQSGKTTESIKNNVVNTYYQLNKKERLLVHSVVNGQAVATRNLRETETRISDKKKVILYTEQTPYSYKLSNGLRVEVLKSEMTCEFEEVE